MRNFKTPPRILALSALLASLGACGLKPETTANLSESNADPYYKNGFAALTFVDACEKVKVDGTAPASYKQTLDVLFTRAKVANQNCQDLSVAFQGRNLDLHSVGSYLELGLIVKVIGPQKVDLSYNELTDQHLTEFATSNINGSLGGWERTVRSIDLSANRFTSVRDILGSRQGVRLLEGVENIQLADNAITSLDDIPGDEASFVNLKVLNLARNPLKLAYNGTSLDRDTSTVRFLSSGTLAYLDISNTGIDSVGPFTMTGNPSLVVLNLDGLNFKDTAGYRDSNFPQLIHASARGVRGLPGDFFSRAWTPTIPSVAPKLSYLDLSGSDWSRADDLKLLPELDVLLMSQTRIADFAPLAAGIPSLDVLSVYATAATGTPIFANLGLLDAQKTAVVPGTTYVTVQDSCAAGRCKVGPATEDRRDVAADFALCPKDKRKPDGTCQVAVGVCTGPVTEIGDPVTGLLKEMCCETTAPLVVGEISLTPVNGKVCTGDITELGIFL